MDGIAVFELIFTLLSFGKNFIMVIHYFFHRFGHGPYCHLPECKKEHFP